MTIVVFDDLFSYNISALSTSIKESQLPVGGVDELGLVLDILFFCFNSRAIRTKVLYLDRNPIGKRFFKLIEAKPSKMSLH